MSTQTQEVGMPLSAKVAANIKAEAARRGWSQRALAARMGLSHVAVSDRGRGRTPWTIDEIEQAARLFGMPAVELLKWAPWDSNPQPTDYGPRQVRHLAVVRRGAAA